MPHGRPNDGRPTMSLTRVLLVAALAAACSRGSPGGAAPSSARPSPSAGMGVTNLQPTVDVTSTVARVSASMCDRLMACTAGGPPPFASRAVCLDEMRGSVAEGLNSATCPGGLDAAQVAVCLKAVESKDCSRPSQSNEPVDECSAGALCSRR